MTISTELPINTDPGSFVPPQLPSNTSEQFLSPIPDSMMMGNFESPSDAFPPSNNVIQLTPQIIQTTTFQTPEGTDGNHIQAIYNSTPLPTPYATPIVNFPKNNHFSTPKKGYPVVQPVSAPPPPPPPSSTIWDGSSPIISNFAPLRESDEEATAIGLGLSLDQIQVDQAKTRYIQQIKQQEYHRLLMEKQNQLQHISHLNNLDLQPVVGATVGATAGAAAPEFSQSDGDKSLVDASPTTIDAVSSQSSPYLENVSGVAVADESISEEERLFKEITTPMLKLKHDDVFGQFVDFECEYPSSSSDLDHIKNFEFNDYFTFENNQQRQKPKETTMKKKKPSPSSTKVTKKTLKKSPSFTGVSSSPTFIVNQKWNRSSNDIQTKKLEAYSKANQLSFNECSQKIPLFALSSHYSFVYENVDSIDKEETLTRSKSSNNVMIDYANFEKNSSNQLKSLESGLIEFRVDLKKK